MSEHTRGPWAVDPKYPLCVRPTGERGIMQTNIEITNLVSDYGNNTRRPDRIAFASGFTPRTLNRSYEEAKANARLIAAAPTMLAALKECREAISAGPFAAASAYQTVLDAIARAEGRE